MEPQKVREGEISTKTLIPPKLQQSSLFVFYFPSSIPQPLFEMILLSHLPHHFFFVFPLGSGRMSPSYHRFPCLCSPRPPWLFGIWQSRLSSGAAPPQACFHHFSSSVSPWVLLRTQIRLFFALSLFYIFAVFL